jgi:hypothetical protein
LAESVHHSLDTRRQGPRCFQKQAGGAEGYNRRPSFDTVSWSEQPLDFVVEVGAASVQLGAYSLVDSVGRAMLDLPENFSSSRRTLS